MSYTSDELVQYLSLSGLIQLRYQVEEDFLEIFRIDADDTIYQYKGTLEVWLHSLSEEAEGGLSEEAAGFCRDMQQGKDSIHFSFRSKGHPYAVHCNTRLHQGKPVCYGIIKQLHEDSEPRFRRASDKDDLLDILSRKSIIEYARYRLSHPEFTTYLVVLDLDNFKMVNDTYGHMFGDTVLMTFAEIVKRAMGNHGLVGRLGGDEFLVVTKGIPNKAALRPFLREIRISVELAYKGTMNDILLTCSMGAASYPEQAASYEDALALADKMLYLAKEKGRNRYLIYTPELHNDYVNSKDHPAPGLQNPIRHANHIGILQHMLSEYLTDQASANEFIFEQIGLAFGLGEILCIYNHGTIGFRWNIDGETLRPEDMHFLEIDSPVFQKVNENGLYLIDGRNMIQEEFPKLYEKLAERKIEAAIFYRLMRNGMPDGYVMFAKHLHRQKWSEYETITLAVAAKIFEIAIHN